MGDAHDADCAHRRVFRRVARTVWLRRGRGHRPRLPAPPGALARGAPSRPWARRWAATASARRRDQLLRRRLEVPERLHPRAAHERGRPAARYYMSVHWPSPRHRSPRRRARGRSRRAAVVLLIAVARGGHALAARRAARARAQFSSCRFPSPHPCRRCPPGNTPFSRASTLRGSVGLGTRLRLSFSQLRVTLSELGRTGRRLRPAPGIPSVHMLASKRLLKNRPRSTPGAAARRAL